jgi:hypothetical protein
MIAWLGANDLDKFVSIVGSFACIPLVYIYPVSATGPLTSSQNAQADSLDLALDALPRRCNPPVAANRRHPTRDTRLCRHGLHHWHYCYQLGKRL